MKKKTLFDLRRELGLPTDGANRIYEIFSEIENQAYIDVIGKPKYGYRGILNKSYKDLLDTLPSEKIK